MTQPEPVVDLVTPTVDAIRDRWITTDQWGQACGEHRVLDDHHVLEGLRHARADVRALLDRLDGVAQQGYDRAVALLRDDERRSAWVWERLHEHRAATGEDLWDPGTWTPASVHADYLEAHREAPDAV